MHSPQSWFWGIGLRIADLCFINRTLWWLCYDEVFHKTTQMVFRNDSIKLVRRNAPGFIVLNTVVYFCWRWRQFFDVTIALPGDSSQSWYDRLGVFAIYSALLHLSVITPEVSWRMEEVSAQAPPRKRKIHPRLMQIYARLKKSVKTSKKTFEFHPRPLSGATI